SNGKSPVRISQRPSKIIPRFLPARLSVKAIRHLPQNGSASCQLAWFDLCKSQVNNLRFKVRSVRERDSSRPSRLHPASSEFRNDQVCRGYALCHGNGGNSNRVCRWSLGTYKTVVPECGVARQDFSSPAVYGWVNKGCDGSKPH